jgi:hypothetical protein
MIRCPIVFGSFRYCFPLRFHTVRLTISAEFELMDRFEGMKAYRQEDDTVRLFRPDKNMARMNKVCSSIDTREKADNQSAARLALPVRETGP